MEKIERKTIDYRHIVSVVITLGFIACGFIFPNAIFRLAEAVRDFFVSLAYYFCECFMAENPIHVTVNDLPSWQIVESRFSPLKLIPITWEEFEILWQAYWRTWADSATLEAYFILLGDIAYYVSRFMLPLMLFVFFAVLLFNIYLETHNNDYDVESDAVRFFKCVSDKTYRPVKRWISGYIAFLREHFGYVKSWLWMWAFYFNFLTIFVEFLAFYFYFAMSFDFLNVYRQVYKLLLDLTAIVRFLPGFVWAFCVCGILEYWARQVGYSRLDQRERRNSAFVAERGVLTIAYGPMGAGKTKFITDMCLSEEVRMRNQAYEIIIESDMMFPNMHWASLEQSLKKMIRKHVVFSVPTVRRWLRSRYREWQRCPNRAKIFGYDYERYGLEYDDKLRVRNVWDVIDDYACAYFIYTVQSSLLITTYSIRTDMLMSDMGNFPLWNGDFFKRDSRLLDSYSRHSHILDFDMLRLGKRVLKDNPNRYAFGFGVYVITEIDKERKNTLELKHVDPTSDEANQKNDLFNALLKMSRHACVVANRVFVKIFADLQRPESLGADARELGEVVYVEKGDGMQNVLPFFAPSNALILLAGLLFGGFIGTYQRYRFMRSDNTLPMFLCKNIVAKFHQYRRKTENLYGSEITRVMIESGRMNGEAKEKKYFLQSKKIYSRRYATDCLSGIFSVYESRNTIGINDLPEYCGDMARDEELLLQNSFFQLEIHDLKEAA